MSTEAANLCVVPDPARTDHPLYAPGTKRIAVIVHHAKCMIANCDAFTDEDWKAAEIVRNVALAGSDTCDRVMREMAKLQWPDDPSPLEEEGFSNGFDAGREVVR